MSKIALLNGGDVFNAKVAEKLAAFLADAPGCVVRARTGVYLEGEYEGEHATVLEIVNEGGTVVSEFNTSFPCPQAGIPPCPPD